MKRIFPVLAGIVITVISFNCKKELSINNGIPRSASNQPAPITSILQGNVLDENGQPAAGVAVSVGSRSTTTDARGYFRITDAQLDKNASVVTAEYPGYFKAYRTFPATSGVNQVFIKMIKKTLAGRLSASSGGGILLPGGAKVMLPANGVNKAAGGTYTGDINIYAAYIDPTANDAGVRVPGSFMADDKDKKRVVLSSYGMVAVELESPSGEKLQIASGNTATLSIPVPSSIASSAPSSISLWYVDEQTGIWKEEGTATRQGDSYTGQVKHFSYWNCDIGLPAIHFSAVFKTSDGKPLANANVSVKVVNEKNNGYAHGYTDSLGQVSGLIPADKSLELEVFDPCGNAVYAKKIGPFTRDTDLGTLTIPDATSSLITVKGKLLSCNNQAVSRGYATLYFDNLRYNTAVNNKGEFSLSLFTCSGSPRTVQILGVDEKENQQGTPVSVPLTSPVTNAGQIKACGVSSAQYINYTVDGADYVLSSAANDSLVAYSISAGGSSSETYIQGSRFPDNWIAFIFSGKNMAGVYPVDSLLVLDYSGTRLIKPFTVTVTSFPKQSGEFYEGNFSGSFKDASGGNVTHKITCTFRIRKY